MAPGRAGSRIPDSVCLLENRRPSPVFSKN
jgi:hypothetical protein